MLLTYSSAVFAFQKQIQKATCEGVVLFPSSKDWTCKAYLKKWNTSNIDGIASFPDTAVNSLVKRTNGFDGLLVGCNTIKVRRTAKEIAPAYG